MRGDALEVTGERPRETEEPDRDDRHGQREDRRLFRSTGDQIAGRRHQCDPETDREHAEHGGRRRCAEGTRLRSGRADRASRSCRCRHGRRRPCLRASERLGRPARRARGGERSAGPFDRPEAVRSRRSRARRSPDRGARSARPESRAPHPGGTRARGQCAGPRRPRAAARPRRPRCRTRREGAHEDVRTRTGRRGLHGPVGGGGQPEPDVVGDAAAKERRLLRHPRDLRPPDVAAHSARSTSRP